MSSLPLEPARVIAVNQFLTSFVQQKLHQELQEHELQLRVVGVLGDLRKNNHYSFASLADTQAGDSEVLELSIPNQVVESSSVTARSFVQATGVLRAKHYKTSSVEFLLEVVCLEPLEKPEVRAASQREHSALEALKAVPFVKHRFPAGKQITVALIHPKSQEAQVIDDFCNPIRERVGYAKFVPYPASMASIPELKNAIEQASGDMVVIIRGGGDESQFRVFDDPALIEAWSAKNTYRITGIGHTAHRTALDLCSEFVAATPTAAGTHIRDQATEVLKAAEVQQQVQTLQLQLAKAQARVQHLEQLEGTTTRQQPVAVTPASPAPEVRHGDATEPRWPTIPTAQPSRQWRVTPAVVTVVFVLAILCGWIVFALVTR